MLSTISKRLTSLAVFAVIISIALVDGQSNWEESQKTVKEMCKELKTNHRIVEAFNFNNDLFLITEDKQSRSKDPFGSRKRYYCLRVFDTSDIVDGISQSAIFSQAIDMTRHWSNDLRGNWLFYLKNFFFINKREDFTNAQNTQLLGVYQYLIGFNKTMMDSIEMFDAYRFPVGENKRLNIFDIKDPIRINTNIYKYIPKEDEFNLMSLAVKLPQEDISNRIHSILTLPSIGKATTDYGRYFVYYLEKPRKSLVEEQGKWEFKRHVFEPSLVNYGEYNELNWAYIGDNDTEKCVTQNIVNAAALVTTSTSSSGGKHDFTIIEFIDNEYKIKTGWQSATSVSNNLTEVANGSILDLFNCTKPKPLVTTTIATTIAGDTASSGAEASTTTTKKPTKLPASTVSVITEAEPTGSEPPEPEEPQPTEPEPTNIPMPDEPKDPEEKASLLWLWILLILVIVIIIAFGVFYLLYIFVGPFNTFVRRYIISRDRPPSGRPTKLTQNTPKLIELKQINS
ncbi:uncharacterized protein LOC128957680 [Oppia nitens]|uniref:uncharacterized protein LOC128957680 n=1 Tax=Oppia nitens TaxID=1686743 RepID=UPI0023DA1C92|nr:uncharacterized protein LOC128957680 [Oppia nitens]XP_054159459.1 uncharacterized protein LOC128957680 [Oppia nitens]